ncbi:hypothetical protein [Cohnella sp. WQ 127256]|nr:hypothetical protein [Cohnella sp. WQ 127256]
MPGLRPATGTATPRLPLGEFSFVEVNGIMTGKVSEKGDNGG